VKNKSFYTIGELSRISNIPITTLRYYNKIKLLSPSYIEPLSSYRYYSHDQLFIVSIIKELKLFSFSLNEIKEFLKRDNLPKMIQLYEKKKKKLDEQIENLQMIKDRVDNRIRIFESIRKSEANHQSIINFNIELKNIPTRPVVYTRYQSPFNLYNMSLRCIETHNIIERNNLKIHFPFMAIFHNGYEKLVYEQDTDIELCALINEVKDNDLPFIRNIKGGLYATVTCKGAYEKSRQAYLALLTWIKKNNYQITGDPIKLYLVNIKHIKTEDNFVSEIQVPVKKMLKSLPA
jgi:DNA-binding transcriptional MerR regulator/DNA gyrase inhibitor GyrI